MRSCEIIINFNVVNEVSRPRRAAVGRRSPSSDQEEGGLPVEEDQED